MICCLFANTCIQYVVGLVVPIRPVNKKRVYSGISCSVGYKLANNDTILDGLKKPVRFFNKLAIHLATKRKILAMQNCVN